MMVYRPVTLPGWFCSCRSFNGFTRERCRVCDAPAVPHNHDVDKCTCKLCRDNRSDLGNIARRDIVLRESLETLGVYLKPRHRRGT